MLELIIEVTVTIDSLIHIFQNFLLPNFNQYNRALKICIRIFYDIINI
jgi:hypothetical protein